jgi:hypothetical protein
MAEVDDFSIPNEDYPSRLSRYQHLNEVVNSNLSYDGFAPHEALQSDARWLIRRTSSNGTLTTILWALSGLDKAIWSQRSTYFPGTPGGKFSTTSVQYNGTNSVSSGTTVFNNFERTDSFSISFWLRLISLANQQMFINDKADSGTNTRGWAIRQFTAASGVLQFELVSSAASALKLATTNPVLATNVWNHIVCTYNGTSTVAGMLIYVNAVSQALTTVQNNLTTTIIPNIQFNVGAANNASGVTNGYIDEVSVWNTVLTPTQITNIYNAGLPSDLTGFSNLVNWYRMGETDTWPVLNDSKSGQLLTMQNMSPSSFTNVTPP